MIKRTSLTITFLLINCLCRGVQAIPCDGLPIDSIEYGTCGEPATRYNYGRIFPDLTIHSTDPGQTISVTAIPAIAGGVASIKYRGQELIATGGHGSSFGFALHPFYPSQGFQISECDNPTEVGSQIDDHDIDWIHNGYLGSPWLDQSTSGLIAFSSGAVGIVSQIATEVNYALYVPEGGISEWTNSSCASFGVGEGGHVQGVASFFITKKWITLGETVNGTYYPNILKFDSLTTLPRDVEELDTTLVAYLQRRLDTEIFFDPVCGVRYVKTIGEARNNPSFNNLSVAPVVRIFSNAAWDTAVGVIVPSTRIDSKENLVPRIYTLTNQDFDNSTYTYTYRNIASQHGYANLKMGDQVEAHTYFVIGSVAEIEAISLKFCHQWGLCGLDPGLNPSTMQAACTIPPTPTPPIPPHPPLPPPSPVPMLDPDLSGINGRVFATQDTLTLHYSGQATGFNWELNPQGNVSPSRNSASRGVPAPIATASPQLRLGSLSLRPGLYTIRVQVVNGTQQSNWASASITLASAGLEGFRVYPNPVHTSRGDLNITFDQLPVNSSVKIFTVSGRWVKTLSAPAGSASWNLTNDSGDKVASGIYLYLITDGLDHKTHGKFTVIR